MQVLRHVVDTIKIFTDADGCIDFINDTKEDTVFTIVSESFSQTIVPVVEDISLIRKALQQVAHQCEQNSIPLSLIKSTDGVAKKTLYDLDQSFMYTQILKGIQLTIDFSQTHTDESLASSREQFAGNGSRLKDIDKLQKEYLHYEPIRWYACGCFLYSMLNKALRTMEVDRIIQIGFLVCDLHRNIAQRHSDQYVEQKNLKLFTVFRGQGLS